jgi:hypothetical protein
MSEINSGAIDTESVVNMQKKQCINQVVTKAGENQLLKNKLQLYEAHHKKERQAKLIKQIDKMKKKLLESDKHLLDYTDSNKNIESIEGAYHKECYDEEAECHIRLAKRRIQLLKDTLTMTNGELHGLRICSVM